jgi:hypothetical protein
MRDLRHDDVVILMDKVRTFRRSKMPHKTRRNREYSGTQYAKDHI